MKNIKYILCTILCMFISFNNVLAGANVKTENTNDANTKNDKCPVSITVQDNLKNKDMDFSELDCIYYKTNENGEKVLRTEDDEIDFSCVQKFLDKYTNDEFKEAANGKIAEGFPTTNKYCPVYCVEENEFVFPGYAPVINSGGHFTWTVGKNEDKSILDGLTVRLHGTKACRTHVDLEQWIKDYKDIMKDIEDLIKIKNPISSGNGTCTPDANANNSSSESVCSWAPESQKRTVAMTANDYDIIKNVSELSELSQLTIARTSLFDGLGIVPTNSDIKGYQHDYADLDSNRYYLTYAIVSVVDTSRYVNAEEVNAVMYTSYKDTVIAADTVGAASAKNAILSRAEIDGSTSIVTVNVEVHERKCCEWVKEQDVGWKEPPYLSTSYPSIPGKLPASLTWGYRSSAIQEGCGTRGGSVTSYVTAPDGQHCCNGYTTKYIFKCSGATGGNRRTCEKNNGSWVRDKAKYSCNASTKNYSYEERWIVKCPAEGTNATQAEVNAGTSKKCTYGSVPTCPSGYSYSPNDRKCYYADIKGIYNKLNELANLRTSLKQCSDQLKDYDYYLETDMEVEYNETNDSSKNFYLPNKDGVTNTKLIRIDENDSLDNNENKLGKYSSDIIKPSEKSNVSGSISFFGKTYYFNKDSIPYVVCTLSGAQKICNAAPISAYSDYWYDWFARTYVAIYEYRLDGNFYKWVKMPSGESISTEPVGDYKKYNRFIDIGYANYPVHYSTKGGLYEGLNVKITNIGYKNYLYNTYQTAVRNYNSSLTDNDFVNTEGQNQLLHDCYYEVDEGEPYCPSKGCDNDEYDLGSVRLIYRPISLESPFPGMDASGRNTGSNWCILNSDKTTNCKNTNENVEKYILNNRNTEGSSIYNKDPMYEITLTPALIKEIRNYNSKTNYDDYYVYCSGEKGKEGSECKSKFVRGESVSIDSMPGVLGDLADNISKAITGCGKDEWDSCDKLDNYER